MTSKPRRLDPVYKVSWHLWEACSFLLKVTKLNKTETVLDIDESMNVTTDKKELTNDDEYFSDNPTDFNTTCENIANSIANVFEGMQNGIFNTENSQHEQVGNMVATQLSQMNSYDAAQVSSKIMQILLLYDENNPANPNNFNIKSESS